MRIANIISLCTAGIILMMSSGAMATGDSVAGEKLAKKCFEGQGPEHSSARLERYLQLCAEDNIQVCNITTPANYYHVLRRQLMREFRKPLIIMTPKSLLRHKKCVSRMDEMAEGTTFHRVLWDDAQFDKRLAPDAKIKRVVMCSGKVYYDLEDERDKRGIKDVYIMRLEQLYPFPDDALGVELKRFPNADFVWCQEEPRNMGSWTFIHEPIEDLLDSIGRSGLRVGYAGRTAAASPATGSNKIHHEEQAQLVSEALEVKKTSARKATGKKTAKKAKKK